MFLRKEKKIKIKKISPFGVVGLPLGQNGVVRLNQPQPAGMGWLIIIFFFLFSLFIFLNGKKWEHFEEFKVEVWVISAYLMSTNRSKRWNFKMEWLHCKKKKKKKKLCWFTLSIFKH
jgi:uncharacterized membrane protein YfcA